MFYKIRTTRYDFLKGIGLIAVLVAIYGYAIFEMGSRLREQALMYELITLRYAVTVYSLVNGRLPEDLSELATKGFVDLKGNNRDYLPVSFAKNKGLVDPFGNAYNYDRESGWITTSTEKYKRW